MIVPLTFGAIIYCLSGFSVIGRWWDLCEASGYGLTANIVGLMLTMLTRLLWV